MTGDTSWAEEIQITVFLAVMRNFTTRIAIYLFMKQFPEKESLCASFRIILIAYGIFRTANFSGKREREGIWMPIMSS